MKYFIISLFALITISSCKNPYIAEIQTIDSLLVALDSAKVKLNKLDTGKVLKRIKIIEKNLNYIYDNADTVNREQAFLIDDYSTTKKYYSKGAMRFGVMFTEIETVPRQLENLRKDLNKNILDKHKANTYLRNEKMAAEALMESINTVHSRVLSLEDTFNESHEKILLLIQSIDSTQSENIPTVIN